MSNIIAQGAEALILRKGNEIIKQRIKKSYRLPQLDIKLRKQRTKKESKLLEKASLLIPVPKIMKHKEYNIELELIKGKKLSDNLDSLKNALKVCELIGKNIAKLHDSSVIHGDLTTSNMIYVNSNILIANNKVNTARNSRVDNDKLQNIVTDNNKDKVFFIDFGLGFESAKAEDKAVDLHVLKEALEARHFKQANAFWHTILEGYKISSNFPAVFQRLKKVEQRGRYKQQY